MSSNELRDVSGFGVTLGNLYIEAQGHVPVLLENLHGISCSGTCWPLGGAWLGMEGLMSSCQLMFPGVRSSLVFSGFGLKPPASGFQSYFYSSLDTSLLYSTTDKTSRLKMKSFSTVRDIQRGSQSYMEKRRGRS